MEHSNYQILKVNTMNVRRVLRGLAFCVVLVLVGTSANAQAQLAAVNQDGLIQLGSIHPFVVSEYQIDISHLNVSTAAAARDFFRKYLEEGMDLTFDLASDKASLSFDLNIWSQGSGDAIPVAMMNQKLNDVHRLRR